MAKDYETVIQSASYDGIAFVGTMAETMLLAIIGCVF